MMMLRMTFLTIAMFCVAGLVHGEEAKPASAPDQKQIDQWARELDADEYDAREAATKELIKAGAVAVPAVEKAAQSESFEQLSRAMRVLETVSQSKDKANKEAATTALNRLAKSKNEQVAGAANDALNASKPKANNANPNPNSRVIQLPGGGQIQLQIAGGAQNIVVGGAQVRSVSKTVINGNEVTEAKDEKGRQIRIEKKNDGSVTVNVTEKVDGKDTKKEYKADDLEALKKNHPEAHKLYEKYAKNNGIPNVRGLFAQRLQPAQPRRKNVGQVQKKLEDLLKRIEAGKASEEKVDLETVKKEIAEAVEMLKKTRGRK